ncbi:MAG: hypothetical protein HW380_1869 [Magnetococcales bacterium]|nr:hypothetical protein [Magnetococcales bacterium]
MAGIGFVLRKLTYKDDLMGVLAGFGYSSLIATGPWIFTIIALSGSSALLTAFTTPEQKLAFQSVVVYNFSFSLVLTGPIFMVVTRFLADQIYKKRSDAIPGTLLGGMLILFATQYPLVAWFYLYYIQADLSFQIFGLINYALISGIWLASVFISALKAYQTVVRTFLAGMLIGMAANVLLGLKFGEVGMLFGFNIGLAFILFSMIARIFAEYPHGISGSFLFLGYFRKYWDLALGGLVINAAAWSDKWVMWFSDQSETAAGGFVSAPIYDSAMFMAYLTGIPALSVFLFSMETDFFEHYLNFYRSLGQHLPLSTIQKRYDEMTASIYASSLNYLVLQGGIALVTILLAPRMFKLLDMDLLSLGMFRFGVLGAFFHLMVQFLGIFLSYFDFRRDILFISCFFLVTNGLFTWVFMKQGFAFYGFGYFLASLTTFAVAYIITFFKVKELLYQTFVVKNRSPQ